MIWTKVIWTEMTYAVVTCATGTCAVRSSILQCSEVSEDISPRVAFLEILEFRKLLHQIFHFSVLS